MNMGLFAFINVIVSLHAKVACFYGSFSLCWWFSAHT